MLEIGLRDGFLTISELTVSSARQTFTTEGVICGFIFPFISVSQNRCGTALRPIWEFCLGTSVAVAYTNDGYLRDAYRCLQMPTEEPLGPTVACCNLSKYIATCDSVVSRG